MGFDTLFRHGFVDGDTYARYLEEYARQVRRYGRGRIAVGVLVEGKFTYSFTNRWERDLTGMMERSAFPSEYELGAYFSDKGNVRYWASGEVLFNGVLCRLITSVPWHLRVAELTAEEERCRSSEQFEQHLDNLVGDIEDAEDLEDTES